MIEAVYDFAAINRRLNRKPEPVALEPTPDAPQSPRYVAEWQNAGAARAACAGGSSPPYAVPYYYTRLAENERLIRENRAARALMDADAIERKPATFAEVKASHEKGCSIAALRAEVEQMEREQDILGLRLLADKRLNEQG